MLKVLSLLRLPSKCFYIDCDYDSDVIISSCRLLVRKLAVYENIVEFVENNNDNKYNNNNNNNNPPTLRRATVIPRGGGSEGR